ncbi:hypothetical protein ID866_8383 [Astraeus odoratus]|nr:hypothetical protein ID866_8383 [Astraeus odoratus]
MDELSQARAELDRLEKEEHDLLKKLSSVRIAASAQRSAIEELVRRQPVAPINRLPREILLSILTLAIHAVSGDNKRQSCRRMDFAGISRAWRDTIFGYPNFWATIELKPGGLAPESVKAHVERSSGCDLDIAIHSWKSGTGPAMESLIKLIIPSAQRWRSIDIRSNSKTNTKSILRQFHDLRLPSLLRATIICERNFRYPKFLLPENVPALECIKLENLESTHDVPVGPRLVNVTLQFGFDPMSILDLPSLFSADKLTTLTLCCPGGHLAPLTSVHFPHLTSLTLMVGHARQLLESIVAPQLTYFCYRSPLMSSPTGRLAYVFEGLDSKFTSVQHVATQGGIAVLCGNDAYTFCAAFPNVRVAEMDEMAMHYFFESTHAGSFPMDHWAHLEVLAVHGLTTFTGLVNTAIPLLQRRRLAERTRVTVSFVDFNRNQDPFYHGNELSDNAVLCGLYDALHPICNMELKDAPLSALVSLTPQDALPAKVVCHFVVRAL